MTARPLRAALLAAAVLLATTQLLPGQTVLNDGPVQGKGLYFLQPNVIPYSRASYVLDAGRVDIYYTEAAISVEPGWQAFRCPGRTLQRFSFRGETVLYARPAESYALFIVSTALPEGFCAFFDQFLSDFSYFRSAVGAQDRVPFPAVVGLRR
jgi:hypothetical protein